MSDDPRAGPTRRTALKYLTGAAAASVVGVSAATGDSSYGTVVDVAEEGAARDGSESITPILREHRGDDTRFEFPEGRYYMDEQFRFAGADHVAFVGDDATIVPADYHHFEGPTRCFKLGTPDHPARDVRFEGIDFDFTAEDTGIRAIQAQATDGLRVADVTVHGHHDSGLYGPFLFDVTHPDGAGLLQRVRAPDGGAYSRNTPGNISTGPTGILVSSHHDGRIRLRECEIDGFPDNGLYASRGSTVEVVGGRYANSNVASIRLGGRDSYVTGATVEVTRTRPEDDSQWGIRLDQDAGLRVEDTSVTVSEPNGHAIVVQNAVESATIENVGVSVAAGTYDGIRVNGRAGETVVRDSHVDVDASTYAIQLRPRADGGGPVTVTDTEVVGDADGGDRRATIRCDRAGSTFRRVALDQPGSNYRRGLVLAADDCRVEGGTYRARHYPLVSDADGTDVRDAELRSYDEYPAVRLMEGNADVAVVDNVLWNGLRDDGTENLEKHGNEEPQG